MDESDVGGAAGRRENALPTRRTLRVRRPPADEAAPASDLGTIDTSGSVSPSQDAPTEAASVTGVTTGRIAREPLPGGRRDRRRQETAQTALAVEAGAHAAGLRASGTDNPFSVDPTVLAQQKALAERAAALTAKARRLQDLSEQYLRSRRRPAPDDVASAHAVSIVVTGVASAAPGDGTALLRAPITSNLPVVDPSGGPRRAPQAAPAGSTAQGAGSSEVPKGTGPVEARSAFGLEPLDAMTAGLGRARRLRLLQYFLVGVGGAALLTAIMMTVSSLNG